MRAGSAHDAGRGPGETPGARQTYPAHPDASRLPDPALPPDLQGRVRGTRPVRVGEGHGRHVPRGRRLPGPALAIVVLAVAAVVAGAAWGLFEWQSALAQQRRGTGVALELAVPGYGSGSSPIPLRVTGTTEGGSAVSGVRLVSRTRDWLSLYPGTYEVRAQGAPVTSDGRTFSVPEGTWEVRVTGQSAEVTAPDGSASNAVSIAYEALAPQDVTDGDVAAIRSWMLDAGVQGVDAYTSAVETRRSAAGP